MNTVNVQIRRLRANARLPRYMSEWAAGMDLFACLAEPVSLAPGERTLIPTGIAMAMPAGFEGQVRPRSGLALKQGIALINSPGTIDADYRGEIGIIVINHGHEKVVFGDGDRIAQLVIAPAFRGNLEVVDELENTCRGVGGFGHTGINEERDNCP